MTIRSAVTVSLVSEARGGPFVFWDDLPQACATAARLGFDGIEIFPPGPEAIPANDVGKRLRDNGLTLAAVGTGAGWVKHRLTFCLPDASARAKAKAFVRSIVDAAGALGAPAIVGSMQGRHGDGVDAPTARAWLCEALEELGEHARQYRVPLVYEPLNRYETNQTTTLAAGAALVESLTTKNVRLLADLFHMNIEETDLGDALRAAGAHVGHVHFVDSNRRPAGLGHIAYEPIADALRAIGYGGFCSAEALPYPDSDSAARQTIAACRRWFPHAG